MHQNPIVIENDRLRIRNLQKNDLEALKAMRADSIVYCYEPTFLCERQGSAEEALKELSNMDLMDDRQCILGVFEKGETPVFVGLAELYDYKPSGKVISIGYRFLSKHWRKGIATSCVCALLEYLKRNTEVELITAHVLPENKASAKCLEKNGFEYLLTKSEDWGHAQPTVADVYTLDL
ncbi:MAG: GNAT family N-acetyltransferase [Erysipelotrichaceae bacterium]|nr:GNAT family N-acetyltransferase [Erysipelotrichaceae bacterium]